MIFQIKPFRMPYKFHTEKPAGPIFPAWGYYRLKLCNIQTIRPLL